MNDATIAWRLQLSRLLTSGEAINPRGVWTRELPQQTIMVDMRRPVIVDNIRKLNYRFMAAEAFWILSGDDRTATIVPYNKAIAQFSDDGETFFGAYGPRIHEQLDYVVEKLLADPTTRQAGLTTWRPSPPATKDVPCTVAMFFSIRRDELQAHVFMRSSDIWLGVPYDVFNFSMLAHLICARLNERKPVEKHTAPGILYLTAASSHLYETNVEGARSVLAAASSVARTAATPGVLFTDRERLLTTLHELRDSAPGHPLRWWEA